METTTITTTVTMPTAAALRQNRHVLLNIQLPDTAAVQAVAPREKAHALAALAFTLPDPWCARQVAETLTPGPRMHLPPCDTLANLAYTLPEKMAYPLRNAVWHGKAPLHAEALTPEWHAIMGAMADAAAAIQREKGADLAEHVRHCGQTFAKACAVPPHEEAVLAQLGYTACELAFVTLLTTCEYLGAAITKFGMGDGQSLIQASEAAAEIVERAVQTRTRSLNRTKH